jgi:type VI protein secretion system component VasF
MAVVLVVVVMVVMMWWWSIALHDTVQRTLAAPTSGNRPHYC